LRQPTAHSSQFTTGPHKHKNENQNPSHPAGQPHRTRTAAATQPFAASPLPSVRDGGAPCASCEQEQASPLQTFSASPPLRPPLLNGCTPPLLHNQFVTAAHRTWRARTGVDR
jgi:hypothetical protein